MIILGLTGSIASGKSSVARTLHKFFHAHTLDIDDITHNLLEPNNILYNLYLRHFGHSILNDDLTLNRRAVADIIFNNKSERLWINSVAHPILLNRARDFLIDCHAAQIPLAVIECPLLFDAGWQNLFDQIWCIYVPYHLQIQRLMARDNLSYQQAISRIRAQMHVNRIKKKAHLNIKNSGSYKFVRAQIFNAARRLLP